MHNKAHDLQPTVRPDLTFRELDDGGVVFDYRTDTIHSLNTTAAYIWILCDGQHTVADIVDSIRNNFSQFESDPEQEVIRIIEQFRELNLLTDN